MFSAEVGKVGKFSSPKNGPDPKPPRFANERVRTIFSAKVENVG